MSTNLVQTKSMLAKLLAGENLNVVHEKISTAFFDLKTRTLHLPIWEVMDGDLYDLLVGHEDGHALYTPQEGWHSALCEHGPAFKSCLNVIEDARIEKIIKRKYPGLSRSFSNGYRDLFERDFFGVKKIRDLSKLNIIDRINLYFKVGAHLIVPFTDEERELVADVAKLETWEQVVEVSKRVYEHAKNEKDTIRNTEDLSQIIYGREDESMPQDMEFEYDYDYDNDDEDEDIGDSSPAPSETSDEEGSEEESEESQESGSGDNEQDEESEKTEEGGESSEDDGEGEDSDSDTEEEDAAEASNNSDDSEEEQNAEGGIDPNVESVTDRMFRERESELVAGNTEVYTYTMPQPFLENIIVPNSVVTKFFYDNLAKYNTKNYTVTETCTNEFLKTNNRYISMLLKEFEMRKNASQYARTTVARTGELDMGKLHGYKFTNDIFRKVSVVAKGKSHGMIMFVDMSGSMGGCFGPTIEQVLILATFCKKAGIPFDVYGFTDASTSLGRMISEGYLPRSFMGQKWKHVQGENMRVNGPNFNLRHLIGSDLKMADYRKSFGMLCAVSLDFTRKFNFSYLMNSTAVGFDLNGTPFTQTLLASRKIIEKFNNKHKLDITNVVYLTDGEGSQGMVFADVRYQSQTYDSNGKPIPKVNNKIYLVDPITKQRCEFGDKNIKQQAVVTEFVRQLTGCKHIGFYLERKRSLRHKLAEVVGAAKDEKERQSITRCFKDNDYFSGKNLGYDNYYYVASRETNVEDAELKIEDGMTNHRMFKAFEKVQNNKKKNRVLISRFTEEIAKV